MRRDKIMKKKIWIQILAAVALVLAAISYDSHACAAAEKTELTVNSFYQINEDTQMRESASEAAKVVQELTAGDTVMVTAYTDGEWCTVSKGDKTGYVPISVLTSIGNVDTLNAEFDSIGNDYETIYVEMLELKRQKRNRTIWGSIIVVLVIAIFGVGILSAVKKNREEQERN